jgi:rubredoxin
LFGNVPDWRHLRIGRNGARFRRDGNFFEGRGEMEKYVCTICGYVYDATAGDPENGVAPGTPFSELPESWVCPVCGAGKEAFEPV